MKKENANKNSNSNDENKEKGIKYTEIIVAGVISLLSLIGGIFSIIAIVKHSHDDYGNVDNAITGLVVSIASIILIFYLLFEVLFTEHVYDIELSIRMVLVIISFFAAIVSIGFGIQSFLSTIV